MNITLNGIRRDDSFNKSAAFRHVSKDHINYFDYMLCVCGIKPIQWHKNLRKNIFNWKHMQIPVF